jgi:hypothetical protein
MADADSDLLRDAIIGTEKEIFGEAFGQESTTLDDTGDRSLEAMGEGLEGQHEPDEDDEDGEGDDQIAQQGKADKDTADLKDDKPAKEGDEPDQKLTDRQEAQGRVPAGRFRAKSEEARAAQAERDAFKAQLDAEKQSSQQAIAALNAKHDALMAFLQRQQMQAAQPKPAEADKPQVPDLFENPTAFAEYLRTQAQADVNALREQMRQDRLNASSEMARAKYGETYDAAYKAVSSLNPNDPGSKALVQGILSAPNPGEALVSWHRRNETLREVGEDPAAYKARVADETRKALIADPEFRKQILEGMRSDAERARDDDGQPRSTFRIPPSLQRVAGGNGRAPDDMHGFDGSESAIFNSAFST